METMGRSTIIYEFTVIYSPTRTICAVDDRSLSQSLNKSDSGYSSAGLIEPDSVSCSGCCYFGVV